MRAKRQTITVRPNHAYRPKAIMHYVSPQNEGRLEDADGRGFASSTADDEHLELSIKVDSQATVYEAKFRAAGSPALVAVGSIVTQLMRNNSLRVAMALTSEDLDYALGHLPALRRYTTTMAITALRQAVSQAWKKRQSLPLQLA